MSARQPIDPNWWEAGDVGGVPMLDVLAERDIKSVFNFLRRRGWSWAAIAQATDIGEQRVREIAGGKRRIENYDVYVRVAVGLNIPRAYLGVGLHKTDQATPPRSDPAAVFAGDPPAPMRLALDVARPVDAGDREPDLGRFQELVLRSWSNRRQGARQRTTLVLVAGFAGSGKSEFARFLSATTGWALCQAPGLMESGLSGFQGCGDRVGYRV